MSRKITGLLIGATLLVVVGTVYLSRRPPSDRWLVHIHGLCSFSSPRPADLNGDGVLDIVFGAGADEFQGCDSAVIALDGTNGQVLWSVPGRDQMVGSPLFHSIDEDQVPDVVISGRAGQLMAISGKSGRVLWSYFSPEEMDRYPDSTFLNFYGPQLIPDQDHDGRQDLLVSYGGDATIPWNDPNRPAGKLIVVSSATGRPLVQANLPDGAETYMTPLCADLSGNGSFTVIFGSGGESLAGHLYRIPLGELLNNNLSSATVLATGQGRGFIAPPVLVDITHDNILDIVVNAVDGRMMAFDGENDLPLWEVHIPGAEVYGSLAVGNFTGDDTPDFFTNVGRGIFPEVSQSIQLMVDGQTGQVAHLDSLGFLQIGSPLVVDVDDDGWDEAIMSVNWYDSRLTQNHYYSLYGISNELLVFHFKDQTEYRWLGAYAGVNPAATPWIGDIDNDQQIDVIYTYITDTVNYQPFSGMKILREEVNVSDQLVKWGSYMGSTYDGLTRDKTNL